MVSILDCEKEGINDDPSAEYVHCAEHSLNLVVSNLVAHTPEIS